MRIHAAESARTAVFRDLANEKYPYDFWRSPAEVRAGRNPEAGISCAALVHIGLARMGVWLPAQMHANEMHLDMQSEGRHIAPAPRDSRLLRPGDVMFFGLDCPDRAADQFVPRYSEDGRDDLMNWSDSVVRHVAVVAENEPDVGLTLLHIDRGGIALVSPDAIMSSEWHEKIWGVGRPVALREVELQQ